LRLAPKLTLLLSAASAGPLLFVTGVTLPRSREALRRDLDALYAQSATALATQVDRMIRDRVEVIARSARAVKPSELEPSELTRWLQLVYRQTDGASIVSLLDGEGKAVVTPVFLADPAGAGLSGHEAVTEAGLGTFAEQIPFDAALRSEVALGPPYVISDRKGVPIPRMAIAVTVAGSAGERWVLAVESSLRPVQELIASHRIGETGGALLLDAGGKAIAHRDPAVVQAGADLSERALKRGGEWLGAGAEVSLLGWKLLVEQPAAEGLAPIRGQVRASLLALAVAVLAALVLGLFAVRTVTRPVGKLDRAARSVAGGELTVTVDLPGSDELANLGTSFNDMVKRIREQRDEIAAKNAEIIAWNAELEERVIQKSEELTVAQDQVTRAESRATLAELAATMAHEINNPLTGVLGTIQFLRTNPALAGQPATMLASAEKEGRRIAAIVRQLSQLVNANGAEATLVDVNEVVGNALGLVARQLRDARVQVEQDLRAAGAVLVDRDAIRQAFVHIFKNVIGDLGQEGGVLTVRSEDVEGRQVRVRVENKGSGLSAHQLRQLLEPQQVETILDPKQGGDARNRWLGLKVAQNVVNACQGQLLIEDLPQQGALFTIIFPVAQRQSAG
jgi:signal transduction histidine kinase